MSVPKIIGLEQEYGITVKAQAPVEPLSQVQAAFLLVNSYHRSHKGLWDYGCETPYKSVLHRRMDHSTVRISDQENITINNPLSNGARYYVDQAHPEYATPECLTAHEVVACDKAGERILEQSRRRANESLGGTQEIQVFKNNSDHKGNAYGCHENYTVEAATYQKLFREPGLREFIPFLVSRQVICGAGKVGQENSPGPHAGYQLSQRADFCETIYSIKTMTGRPLLNTRDEPHADRRRFRRLHLILGDANMSEISAYLKVGTTQLVLRMIEDQAITRRIALDTPVQAVRDISLDTTCKTRVKLRDGRKFNAIEIQSEYLEMAQAYGATHRLTPAEQTVLTHWERTLRLLREEPMELRRELDWVIKKWLLEQQMARHGFDWYAPRLRQLDIQYHNIDPTRSLFYLLQGSGQVERILDDTTIERFVMHPSDDTRAYTRATCLRPDRLGKFAQAIWALNWERLFFRFPDRQDGSAQHNKILLLNPFRGTKAEHEALFTQTGSVETFLEAFHERHHRRR